MAKQPEANEADLRDADPRDALGEAFVQALWADWQTNGAKAIERVRADKPDLYVKLVTAILPKAPEAKAEAEELDDAALDRRIETLAAALGLAIGAGARPRRKGAAKKS